MGKLYRSDRTVDGVVATADGEALPERTDVELLSRDGFERRDEGDAPAPLAPAIVADQFGDVSRAPALHGPSMRDVVADFSNGWEMTTEDVDEAVRSLAPSAGAAA